MHSEWTDQLSGYLDDELAPGPRADLDRHLAQCAECARTLAELRAVASWARAYRGAEPARDLWPGVRERIDRDKGAAIGRMAGVGWRQLIAAGIAVVAIGGGALWLGTRGPVVAPPEEQVHRDPVQPRAERALAGEGTEFLPGPDEHLLHGLLGVVGTHHPAGERVDPPHVRTVQPLEGLGVAPGGQADVVELSVLLDRDLEIGQHGARGRWNRIPIRLSVRKFDTRRTVSVGSRFSANPPELTKGYRYDIISISH
jgi:hypothetical protein